MVSLILTIEAKNFCAFRKMEKSVIKHLYLKGLKPKEIKAKLDEVHGTSSPVFATVYNYVNEFKCGRISTKDKHRSGRPVEVTTPEMIDKIHDMVLSDQRIARYVFSILHEKLGVKKISARRVPRLLSEENKRNRMVDSAAIWRFSVVILTSFCVDT